MSSWLKDGHTTVPDPELERADLVHLCMVIIRIELSMSRTESAIRRWAGPCWLTLRGRYRFRFTIGIRRLGGTRSWPWAGGRQCCPALRWIAGA